ncbi:MAG: 5-formyltetrahydrofolate cyclo-ligase [Prevotella sp.]|jgi:5-formyltetrahydrofolate cyclo-ligase|nr:MULTISPECIES: 5-formyltetrahydrofolate cyclo-ligase [unclassified Prevotella]MCH3970263.1 5-formyltetrahydrofolate cyclo-ligase [Prevotella sp.]MCH4017014.1 5-formyltetrahydrofolate cyclo-ligase [Prevotella sp.]MCH4100065.1 5-formyltetrahydrofolate cyclo-ligase [Prevotella sp.]MCH4215637.1 5-formyltetrahydrofolate cyclo-ligase [Prevotella sp.]MCH4250934.1 5-formyltetrahydrofolate cyclo-ligase [Prevotella sp.]
MLDKRQLRQLIREQKRMQVPSQRKVQSEAIAKMILHHPKIKAASTLLLYAALPDEVETQEILDSLVKGGKMILLPAVINQEELELRRYENVQNLQKGAYQIQEPVGMPFDHLEQVDVAVIPGMAFDCSGNRLGRGKGYYDRLLRKMPHCYKIGICFDFQKFRHIPSDPYDIKMDEIITYSNPAAAGSL